MPVLASVAPLLVAVALWAITGSPYALLFAVLGPVTMVASVVDARLGARRASKRAGARYAADLGRVRDLVIAGHAAERADLDEAHPSARVVAGRLAVDPGRWGSRPGAPMLVTVGRGRIESTVELEGLPAGLDADPGLAELGSVAGTLTDAPIVVDARLGIGVCGVPPLALALARSLAIQLAWSLSPADHWLVSVDPALSGVPHAVARSVRPGYVTEAGERSDDARASDPLAGIAVATVAAELPVACRILLRVDATAGVEVVEHPDRRMRGPILAEFASTETTRAWVVRAAADAARDGLTESTAGLPVSIALRAVLDSGPADSSSGLACVIGADQRGAYSVDLVADGPHAVVGGTTGSGKSELLVSWILSMAADRSPSEVNFLLVDFKGGSAFACLEGLPHVVGILTDLDHERAERALSSLRAELRFRERALVEVGVKTVEHTALARLVIVIDEFAAMMAEHPDLHALFADIAARGRALGVHLILCTQRPAGVMRDALLANADLRVSLRVNNRADSVAVIGSDAAAALTASAVGRGVVALTDRGRQTVQFALSSPDDVLRVAGRWAGSDDPRRPWCEPLPDRVAAADAAPGFGLIDLPDQQRRSIARWLPDRDGHVFVLGAPRSGKSTALAALGVELLSGDVVRLWDDLEELASASHRRCGIDDLDSVLARVPTDHRESFAAMLTGLLRDGPARGIHLALSAQRMTGDLLSVAGLIPSRLLLRHAGKQDFLLAGGDSAQFRESLPAGGGVWRGDRVQVVDAPALPGPTRPARCIPVGERPLAVVSSRADRLTAALRAAGRSVDSVGSESIASGPGASDAIATDVVGDVDEWQSRWGALAAHRATHDVLFDRCSVADFRALTRSRRTPPPLDPAADLAWRWEQDGSAIRALLPLGDAGRAPSAPVWASGSTQASASANSA